MATATAATNRQQDPVAINQIFDLNLTEESKNLVGGRKDKKGKERGVQRTVTEILEFVRLRLWFGALSGCCC